MKHEDFERKLMGMLLDGNDNILTKLKNSTN
jgi:hypothetical protein